MKVLLLLSALLPFVAQGFDPHEGGGGSICVPEGRFTYRSLDEVYFGDPRSESPLGEKLQDKADPRIPNLRSADLIETSYGKRATEKLAHLRALDSRAATHLLNSLFLLRDVFVIDSSFSRESGAPSSLPLDPCILETVRSVIITDSTGQTVVSKKDWERLTTATQEILLIHEALRMAPFFAPSLEFSESELYELTMLIWKKDFPEIQLNQTWLRLRATTASEQVWTKPELLGLIETALTRRNPQAAFLATAQARQFRLWTTEPAEFYPASNVLDLKKDRRYVDLLRGQAYWRNF